MSLATTKPGKNINNKDRFSKENIAGAYRVVRNFSHKLASPLTTEDYVIQSMPDVSPTKWHLAHTSWFFEEFVLSEIYKNYESVDPRYRYLFNSYYVQVGERHCRPKRGLISRPTVNEIYDYREYVDNNMDNLFKELDEKEFAKIAPVIEIGIHHEQQHQELILTDIKNVFSENPLDPLYSKSALPDSDSFSSELDWIGFDGGIYEIGNDGSRFGYDNEGPLHETLLQDFKLASRLTTNGEYMEFMEDGGYEKPELWLSDGWNALDSNSWKAPLYWDNTKGEWWQFTLNGFKKVNPDEPVSHLSFYEAEAFARWAGARLPSEFEWEVASKKLDIEGNFVENGNFNPVANRSSRSLQQMYGDVWEWTKSPYSPYPGYRTLPGALGEYNGKFMCNQMVLRGGSCATSITHIRNTYRNFFPPDARWQFSGLRLAKDEN